MSEQNANFDRSSGLIRGLGLWAGMAVVVGSMIGQAIFLVASDMARELGSPGKVLLLWIVGGIVVLFGAFPCETAAKDLPSSSVQRAYQCAS